MERRAKDEKETRQRKRRVVKKSGKVKKAATGSEIEGGGLRRRSRDRNIQIARDDRDEAFDRAHRGDVCRAATERVRKAPARDLGEPQKLPAYPRAMRATHQEAGVGHAGGSDALVVRGVRGGGGHHGGSLRFGEGSRAERSASSVGVG